MYYIDDVLTFYCNIHDPQTGGVNDADSAPTYRVYEEETGTPILTGSMALLDDSNTTGFYSEKITLSAANGFEENKNYCIRKSATVNGVTGVSLESFRVVANEVGFTADEKEQIRYRLQLDGTQTAPEANAPLQMPVSADAISQDQTAADNWEAMLDGTGGTEFKPGKVTIYASSGSGLNISGDDGAMNIDGSILFGGDVSSDQFLEAIAKRVLLQEFWPPGYFGENTVGERLQRIPNAAPSSNGGLPTVNASNQVAGVSGNVVGSVGSVAGNVVGSVGSLAAQAKADVQAEAAAALTAYDLPTHAELTAALAALNNLSAAEVQAKIEEFWQTFSLPELAAGESPAEATPAEIMAFLWMYFRGPKQSEKTGETTGIQRVYNDAGEIVLDAVFTKTETEYTREKLSLGD